MFNTSARSVGLFEHSLNDDKGFTDSRVLHDFYELDSQKVGFYGGGGLDARFDFTPYFFCACRFTAGRAPVGWEVQSCLD